MKIVRSSIVTLLLVFLFPLAGVASAQADGQIAGQITNGTEGGSVPEEQMVTLTIYQNSTPVNTEDTVADAGGHFSFDSLNTSADYSYQLSTMYLSVTYFSDVLTFSDNSTQLSADLPIFETEETTDQLHIVTSHIIIYPDQDHMDILEYYLFLNGSDRTLTGANENGDMSDMATLTFSLPPDAESLQATVGFTNDEILSSNGGFFLITPVAPGMKEIGFSYSVPADNGVYTYLNDLNYSIDGLDLLVNGSDAKVTSDQLEQNDPLQIQGSIFEHYTAANLTAGQQLRVEISQGSSSSNSGIVILIVVVAALLIGGIAWMVYTRRNKEQEPVQDSDADSEELLYRLAKLDDDYEDGIIDATEYQRERDDLKAKLSELMNQENNPDED